jgi:YVTN family beta-propeller protein
MPSAIAVNAAGTVALVAERNRGKIAFINLTTFMVQSELAVGAGPIGIAIQGSRAVVVNGDGNSISIIDLTTNTVAATVAVGNRPRGVAIDAAGLIYVTNQNDGTITVASLATGMVTATLKLGGVRPAAIQIIAGTTYAVVADPATAPDGKVLVVNLVTGATTPFSVNPVRSGGASDIVVIGTTAWIADQTGGSISILPLTITGTMVTGTATTITVGAGVRSLAFDAKDSLIFAVNESAGKVVLVSVPSGAITGSIVAIAAEDGDDDGQDDHSDHDGASNMPHVFAVTPFKADLGTTVTVTATGVNLQGATALVFTPGDGLTVSNFAVNAAGTQVTATVMVSAQAKPGAKKLSIVTPNGTTMDQAMIVVNP